MKTRLQNSFLKFKSYPNRKKFIAIFLLIFILASAFYLFKNKIVQRPVVKDSTTVNYFSVVSTTPSAGSTDNDQDSIIEITFSEPVDPNSLKGFFTVSPMIPGTFSQGGAPNIVDFKSKYPYGKGVSVKVILNHGFQSISGDKFTSDYNFNFYTKLLEDTVEFENNGIYNRLVNLSQGKDIDFNLYTGSDTTENGTITIYKTTFDQLVSSLLYKNESHPDSNYVTQTYLDYAVNTSKMQKISVTNDFKNNDKFNFKQDPGLYYIEAKNDGVREGFVWINVNNEGLIVKEDDQKIIVATQNVQTGDTNQTVNILLYNLENTPTLLNATQIQTYGEIPVQYPKTVDLVVGQTQNGIIIAPVNIPETQADIRVNKNLSDTDKIFLYTDKPAYLAGDTVNFSGILREDNDAQYNLPNSGSAVRVWMQDSKDTTKKVLDQTVNVNSNGIFSGNFTLPSSLVPDANNNYLSTTLYAKEIKSTSTYNSSPSYVTFDVVPKTNEGKISVTFDKDKYTKDENITAHVVAVDTAGNPLANKTVNYSVYEKNYYESDPESVADFGNDWGEITKTVKQNIILDENGKADIELNEKENTVSKAITIEVIDPIENEALTGAKTTLVQQGNIILTFGSSRQNYKTNDTAINRIYVKDLAGNPLSNLNVSYQLYKSEYDNQINNVTETTLASGTVNTDVNGFALITTPINTKSGDVSIRITAKDSLGNNIQSERTMNFSDQNSTSDMLYYHELQLTNLDVAADKLNYNVGDQAHLTINSPFDQNVLISYERGRIYHTEWFTLHKGDNTYTVNITDDLAPSFNVAFSYFNNGSFFIEGLPIIVSNPNRNLQLSVSQNSDQLLITTKDSVGNPVSANILVNILDNNIFSLRNNLPSGDINWFFNATRGDITNFSASTLGIGTGEGCGGGSGIDINYVPNRIGGNLYWNSDLTTDQNGELAIPLTHTSGTRIIVNAVTDNTSIAQFQLQN